MLTMLMMGADDDADDRENYINKLPNSRSTAPRAPNISSSSSSGGGGGSSSSSSSSSSSGGSGSGSDSSSGSGSSLRELGPVSTHDVLCSWREVWVETKGHERRFRKRICEKTPSCACSGAGPNQCFCNGIHGRNVMLAKKCNF